MKKNCNIHDEEMKVVHDYITRSICVLQKILYYLCFRLIFNVLQVVFGDLSSTNFNYW
jgi:hypothetical protein